MTVYLYNRKWPFIRVFYVNTPVPWTLMSVMYACIGKKPVNSDDWAYSCQLIGNVLKDHIWKWSQVFVSHSDRKLDSCEIRKHKGLRKADSPSAITPSPKQTCTVENNLCNVWNTYTSKCKHEAKSKWRHIREKMAPIQLVDLHNRVCCEISIYEWITFIPWTCFFKLMGVAA